MSHRSRVQNWQRVCAYVPLLLCARFQLTVYVSPVLDTPAKLGKIVVGMNRALGEIPVTVKLRTGVKEGRNNAHKLMPRLSSEWGVGCITASVAPLFLSLR